MKIIYNNNNSLKIILNNSNFHNKKFLEKNKNKKIKFNRIFSMLNNLNNRRMNKLMMTLIFQIIWISSNLKNKNKHKFSLIKIRYKMIFNLKIRAKCPKI